MIDITKLKSKIINSVVEGIVEGHEGLDERQVHNGLYNLGLIEYDDMDTAIEVFEHLESAIVEELDHNYFQCESCSWWFEHGEAGDEEGNCENCVDS